jgi:hypothetical protein
MTVAQAELLREWLLRLRAIYRAYYASAEETERCNFWLGVTGILFTAILASKFVFTVGFDSTVEGKAILALFGLLAVCIPTIQLFVKLPERAEKFRVAGVSYSGLHRQIEHLLVNAPTDAAEIQTAFISIQEQWAELAKVCPTALPRVWKREVTKHFPIDITIPKLPGTN